MKSAGWIVLIYGFFVFIGGLIGHVKAASQASLISGIVFGVLLMGSAWALFKQKRWGYQCSLVLAFILDGFFTYRWMLTHHFMPSGMMAVLSLGVLIVLVMLLKKQSAGRGKYEG